MLGPVIAGERVRLVPPAPEMLETFCRWFADTEVTRYLGGLFPQSLESEKEWFTRIAKSETDVVWAALAVDGDAERLIGTTAIHQIDWQNRRAVTGNLIGEKSEWNKGYGSETVRLRTRFAFEMLPLEKLESETFANNAGSRRVLEKAGYQTIGTKQRHIFRHGQWHDLWICEVLKGDWLAANL